jgi:TolB-like protein
MKATLSFLLLLPAIAFSSPVDPVSKASVAVFDFKSDWNVDYHIQITDAGKAVASGLAHDLCVLAPLTVIDQESMQRLQEHRKFDLGDSIAPADAKQVGQALGATTLVTGRIYRSGIDYIVVAKVVSAETGQALGTMVKGDESTSFADLMSQLSQQVGKIALVQQGFEQTQWSPATIAGTQVLAASAVANTPREELAVVVSIDGKDITDNRTKWSQEHPLLPGEHNVVIYYTEGRGDFGRLLSFDAKPGASYAVVYNQGAREGYKLWIQDQGTHQPVKILNDLSPKRNNESPFYLQGGGVWIGGYFSPSYPQIGIAPPVPPAGGGHSSGGGGGHK